ncbi:uncharacterized protein A4U43_C07F27660 [Asparagus officinalis]|uniref:Uncharacterized protein n=1 Tax=Asparagus officinalis TaxID=4686 RepID=A0A5P1EFB8_ASPOF|nr:uncharacterized protein A4U43_C07F27660 [Asparagus officinalis]
MIETCSGATVAMAGSRDCQRSERRCWCWWRPRLEGGASAGAVKGDWKKDSSWWLLKGRRRDCQRSERRCWCWWRPRLEGGASAGARNRRRQRDDRDVLISGGCDGIRRLPAVEEEELVLVLEKVAGRGRLMVVVEGSARGAGGRCW